ncbi:MAG: gliding motility lipoprotein GldD [Bacteroidetes bacterium RBG_13_46_8]|nr:MAG: gliding motility lipoprotein GldD [Bacteroidetes bacterium RBG_13_46_8]
MRNLPGLLSMRRIVLPVLLVLMATGCNKTTTPKPRAYFRIDFPEKEYRTFSGDCPYTFEYPVYGEITDPDAVVAEPCWYNIDFPAYKGKIHLTYKTVDNNLSVYLEDIRTLAYKHIIKADDIIDKPFYYPERHVYGMIYDIRGNTASSVSFFATDSVRNFLSGSLYFGVQPNIDSLSPVISYFKEDIVHLIETLKWN